MNKPQYAISVALHGRLDHAAGDVPEWCDLSMDIVGTEHQSTWVSAWDDQATLYLTREAGQLIIDTTTKALHPYAGGSIVTLMEKALDVVVARLLDGNAQEGDKDMARGMAMMIAILYRPTNPDWMAVRDACVARINSGVREESKPNKSRRGH